MIGLADDGDTLTGLGGDGGDDADLTIRAFDGRPLFDMGFDIGDQLIRAAGSFAQTGRIEAVTDHGVGHGHTGRIRHVFRNGLDQPGHGTGADHGSRKARAFLVPEAHDFNGEWQARALFLQSGDQFDPQHNPEIAVKGPAIADRIEMGADHQRRSAGRQALIAPDQAPGRVQTGGQAGLFHPLRNLRERALIGRTEPEAEQTARCLAERDIRENTAPLDGAGSVGCHGGSCLG